MAQVPSDNSEGKTTKHRFQYFFFLAQIFCRIYILHSNVDVSLFTITLNRYDRRNEIPKSCLFLKCSGLSIVVWAVRGG